MIVYKCRICDSIIGEGGSIIEVLCIECNEPDKYQTRYDVYDYMWKSKDKGFIHLDNMDTNHIFNCLKMLYNHIANMIGAPRVMFTKEYEDLYKNWLESPDVIIDYMKAFIITIEKRQDLHGPNNLGYHMIKEILSSKSEYHEQIKLLASNKEYNNDKSSEKKSKEIARFT